MIVGEKLSQKAFLDRYTGVNTRIGTKWEREALTLLYDYLKDKQQGKVGSIINKADLDEAVENLNIYEIVNLYVELTGENFYGEVTTDTILEIIELLEKGGSEYVDYIQVGVRGDILVVFIG